MGHVSMPGAVTAGSGNSWQQEACATEHAVQPAAGEIMMAEGGGKESAAQVREISMTGRNHRPAQ